MAGSRAGRRGVDLREAAELLGTTSEAIRKRAKRGTLDSEPGEDGRLYVWVDSRVDGDGDRVNGRVDETRERVDGRVDDAEDDTKDALISRMASEIAHLREQLHKARAANRENRRIIAGLVNRVPELEPPREALSEPRESPVSASSEEAGTRPPDGRGQEKRSWWRRLFQ
jgi:hypothetical protein